MRKTTVKEVKTWFKTLEENRYKKTYASDARRVSWLVNNNLSEDYEAMPISMKKKWPKAAYKRERFLAKEFVKHLRTNELNQEMKLKESIRKIVKGLMTEQKKNLTEAKRVKYKERDWKKYEKLAKKGKNIMIQTSFGDHFSWDTADRDGVWALDKRGKEFELTHDDIDVVEIY